MRHKLLAALAVATSAAGTAMVTYVGGGPSATQVAASTTATIPAPTQALQHTLPATSLTWSTPMIPCPTSLPSGFGCTHLPGQGQPDIFRLGDSQGWSGPYPGWSKTPPPGDNAPNSQPWCVYASERDCVLSPTAPLLPSPTGPLLPKQG
jgi:hypothetical protein